MLRCKLWPFWSHVKQPCIGSSSIWQRVRPEGEGKNFASYLISVVCSMSARNIRYLRSTIGWPPPQPQSVMPNSLYSHNLQRISATKLPTQLHKQHDQRLTVNWLTAPQSRPLQHSAKVQSNLTHSWHKRPWSVLSEQTSPLGGVQWWVP